MLCDKNNIMSKAFIIIILLAPTMIPSIYLIIRLLNTSSISFTKSAATWLQTGDYSKAIDWMKLEI